jgi:hypothetical protein
MENLQREVFTSCLIGVINLTFFITGSASVSEEEIHHTQREGGTCITPHFIPRSY